MFNLDVVWLNVSGFNLLSVLALCEYFCLIEFMYFVSFSFFFSAKLLEFIVNLVLLVG